MIRKLLIAAAASALLAGCVSDYAYRGGSGDYYYSHPSAYGSYGHGYGVPYSTIGYGYPGGFYGGIGYGYGYHPYYSGGYYGRSYYYPYYPYYRPYRPHRPHRPDRPQEPDASGPVMAGPRPAVRGSGPPAAGRGYSGLPPRRQIAPPSGGDSGPRRNVGSPPMSRPQPRQAAPVRTAVPQQSRPAPRMQSPAPRVERSAAPRVDRQQEP